MDSTKKIVKTLAGHNTGTAAWATNVANERGQILMNVLTASEGVGLQPMAAGLMKRYLNAGVPPRKVLYVDCDCCGDGSVKTKDLFSQWSEMVISLNIWHFMRHIAVGCTTESHPMYAIFLGRLSKCIFERSQEAVQLLNYAKHCELTRSGVKEGGKELEPVKAARDLGVTLDSNLTYNEHIVSTVSSCMSRLGQINRVKHIFNKHALIIIINALVFSKLFYCSSV